MIRTAPPHSKICEAFGDLMHGIDRRILQGEPWREVVAFVCRELVDILGLPLAWIGQVVERTETLALIASAGTAKPILTRLMQTGDSHIIAIGPTRIALKSGSIACFTIEDSPDQRWRAMAQGSAIKAGLALPLRVEGRVEYVLTLYADDAESLTQAGLDNLVERLADHMSLILGMSLERQRRRLQDAAMTSTGSPIFISDREGRIVWSNDAFHRISGYEPQEVRGQTPRILRSGHQPEEFYQQMWSAILHGETWTCEVVNRHKDGHLYSVRQTITPFAEHGEDITHFISIHEDITALKAAHDRIRHLAHHDPLTGLPNRLLLMDRLTQAIERARRERDSITLLFFDLDGFKPVNDSYGHQLGDQLLQEVAVRLGQLLQESDILARIGGDEFVLLLPGLVSEEDTRALARRVLYTLNTPFVLGGCHINISASIGAARWPEHGEDASALLDAADRAMYAAKHAGRGAFRLAQV
ncbi:MAG: diguanylate cyclase [Pseudomonadota bacterium]